MKPEAEILKIPTHTRRKNGRARRRDAASRCPYSRRRLREAPEEVNELVTREIERRIADGQISRAQCMDTHWDWLKHAVLDAAAEAAPARSGRRPMKPGFDVATLLLRERRKKLLPELKEAESAGRAAEAATLPVHVSETYQGYQEVEPPREGGRMEAA